MGYLPLLFELLAAQEIENENVAPGPSLGVAHKQRLRCSIMEGLAEKPIPIRSFLVPSKTSPFPVR
jgi:hypothetical protein